MLKTYLLSTTLLAAVAGSATPALALDPVYGGGGTLAAKVYRQVFDCYGKQVDTSAPVCTGPAATTEEILYAPVGSGAGKKAYAANDPTLLGTPAASNHVPYTSADFPGYPYATLQFAGSDAQLTNADITAYNATKFGNAKQVPMFVTGIAAPFNPPAGGFTYASTVTTPTGGSAPLRLSVNSLCGIFTGAITNWNDASLTTDNAGVTLANAPIKVIVRADGSGTSAIFTQHLATACAATSHPYTGTPGTGGDVGGVANTNPLFAQLRAGNAAGYSEAAGSGGIEAAVLANPGAIAYVSPDYVKQVTSGTTVLAGGDPNGPVTANLQNKSGAYNPVSLASVGIAIPSTSTAPKPTDPNFNNPLTWGQPTGSDDPSGTNSYPIVGFTFVDAYQCYNTAAKAADVKGLFQWYFQAGRSVVNAKLTANGFVPVPLAYAASLNNLLVTGSTAISQAGAGSCTAAGITGAN